MGSSGVLLIATGHANYIRMAFSMALSIKVTNPDCKIALAHSKGLDALLSHKERSYINTFIEVPEEFHTYNGKTEHPMVKTRMYELSPWDKTLYFDADSVWFHTKKIDDLFKVLDGQPVSFQCREKFDIQTEWGCLWNVKQGGLKAIREIYKIEDHRDIYEIQSSMMYFEKGDKAEEFFRVANDCYVKRPFEFFTWAGGIPDELVFNIATALCRIELKNFPFTPLYFVDYLNPRERNAIFEKYYALSMAGNYLPSSVVEFYNSLVRWNYTRHQAHVRFPYLWKNKKQFLPERQSA
jgi:hypothetical protein